MLIKNLLRIVKSYKFSLITIIFYEIIYLLKGFKGNKFHISKNQKMTNNFPCPYYFLIKIEKTLKKNNFNTFIDLGCGSGRVIDFFNKKFKDKKFIGIDYFSKHCVFCKKIFKNDTNIQVIQSDFTQLNLNNYNADCFFFNDPISNKEESVNFLKRIKNSERLKKNSIFIFVNCDKKLLNSFNEVECITSYYINNTKGYSIYQFGKQE